MPEYLQKFRCIGPDCEDTCCFGWGIQIDKDTYKKYKECKSVLKQDFTQKVLRRNTEATDCDYARIKLKNDGICPFLDETRLCKIQSLHGEEFLSVTCATYPRMSHIVDNVLEKSATLSCPEAARLCLLNPDGINFVESEEDLCIKNSKGRVLNTASPIYQDKPEKYFWDLRAFSIQVIKCRDFELWERLLILGLFFDEVQKSVDKGDIGGIPQIIESYQDMIINNVFDNVLSEFESQTEIQMKLLMKMNNKEIFSEITQKRYLECLDDFFYGAGLDKALSDTESSMFYRDAYTNFYKPFFANKSYILENYLVNYMFKNLFPFISGKGLFENYVILALHYSIIKMNLIGMAGFYKHDFNEMHVIKLIQSFSKVLEHNKYFFSLAYEALDKSGFKMLSHIAVLVKDL